MIEKQGFVRLRPAGPVLPARLLGALNAGVQDRDLDVLGSADIHHRAWTGVDYAAMKRRAMKRSLGGPT